MTGRTLRTAAAALTGWLLITAAAQAQNAAEVKGYQQRLQQLFQKLDQNSDQRLEPQEVKGHPYLERHFERLDQQQRGYLTPDDLRPSAQSGNAAGERARRLVRKADRNGDGAISREEAKSYPWLLRRFSNTDRNNDDHLSPDELRDLRSGRQSLQ